MELTVRYAAEDELDRVNQLRAMVQQVHAVGRPDLFQPGFSPALQEHLKQKFQADDSDVLTAWINETICGFAIVEYIDRPASPYMQERRYYHIEEFGVDAAFRRRGVATALLAFCRREAARKGFDRVELDVWEFNEAARRCYEAAGFRTYRRHMEMKP